MIRLLGIRAGEQVLEIGCDIGRTLHRIHIGVSADVTRELGGPFALTLFNHFS